MELQRHGFGAPSAGRSAGTANAPAGASAFAVPPAASGASVASAPGQSRAAAAANERFIGIDGVGFTVARKDVPAVAAIAAAVVAALVVLLVALGISGRRKRRAPAEPARPAGGAAGAVSAAPTAEQVQASVAPAASADDPIERELLAILARNPSSKRALMSLAGHYAERHDVRAFDEIAQRIYRLSGGRGPNWVHVASVGRQLDPDNALFALEAGQTDEQVLTGASDAGEPSSLSTAEASTGAEPPIVDGPSETAAAPGAETEVPMPSAEEPASPTQAPPEAADATLHPAEPYEVEHASAENVEPREASAPPEPERAAQLPTEATLPPEAVAALNALDIGLPPRVDAGADRAADHAQLRAGEPEYDGFDEAAGPANGGEAYPHAAALPHGEPHQNPDHELDVEHEHGHEHDDTVEGARPTPAARPGVAGLGAAPIGPLALSFDLDLPGVDAEGHSGAAAALPEFTPEQLAKIARNKLDLAAEYIALGDLGGARTLIHEVIESKDAVTRDEAHALLATLAPLS
jgi:pilus assembly protein FimV